MSNILLQGTIFSFPEGLSPSFYKNYYNNWIAPYLQVAYRNPEFYFFFYISGIVFEYLQNNMKECIEVLKELGGRGQIEILNGMFYDAAPALQAKTDQKEQLEELSHYISSNNLASVSSKGAWITPGTYEHNHITSVYEQGIKYLFVERSYLEPIPNLNTMCVVESLGTKLMVVPYDRLTIDTLDDQFCKLTVGNLNIARKKQISVLFTYYKDLDNSAECFEQFERFLTNLKEAEVHKYSQLPSPVLMREYFPKTICRIRSAPYGIDDCDSFFKYIITRQESRLLYSRFLYVMKQVSLYKKDKDRRLTARMELRKLQSHFAYWGGNEQVGIHNNQLRQHTYQKLAEIEKLLKKDIPKDKKTSLSHLDFDMDGEDEFLVSTPNNFVILEQKHGSIEMFQRKTKRWNYAACYSPFKKPQYFPSSFKEMVFTKDSNVSDIHDKILTNQYPYSIVRYNDFSYNNIRASLIYNSNDKRPLNIEKQYNFSNNNFGLHYRLSHITSASNIGLEENIEIILATEINLVFSSAYLHNLEIMVDADTISNNEASVTAGFSLVFLHYANKEKLSIESTNQMGISIAPVFGTADFEGRNIYQHHSILIYFPYEISLGSYEENDVLVNFSNINRPKVSLK